jgi:hypothetical protein
LGAEQLALLDDRHPNYDRVRITSEIETESPHKQHLSDVAWTYVAKPSAVARADTAIAAGTARISRPYLDRLRQGLAAHDRLLDAFEREPLPANVPVENLVWQVGIASPEVASQPSSNLQTM